MICPAETPEGQACGLVKNLALMTYISVGSNPGPVINLLDEAGTNGFESIDPAEVPKSLKVFVNGNWLGILSQDRTGSNVSAAERALNALKYAFI